MVSRNFQASFQVHDEENLIENKRKRVAGPLAALSKLDFQIRKNLFSKTVKGETNISCVENRQFNLSKYVSNLCFRGGLPLTFFKMEILFLL